MDERGGVVELLSKLCEEDIYALAKTVTQGLLKFENRDGNNIYIFLPLINLIYHYRSNSRHTEVFPR